ncbi:MAG: sugar transferase [Actinomycetota bacterium]
MKSKTHPALESRAKRMLDLAVAALSLAMMAPVMCVAAVCIRITMGSPALFRQVRPGLHGRPFTLLKFRTMNHELGPDGAPLPDAQRISRLGRMLRQTSMDELPELFNVLAGDMSLVGPRPLLPEYLEMYTPRQARRHNVRPGLTGLTQVSGRNGLSWEQKFELDLTYIDRWSLWLDLKILALSVREVFARRGVSASGHATMPRFNGSTASPKDGGAK